MGKEIPKETLPKRIIIKQPDSTTNRQQLSKLTINNYHLQVTFPKSENEPTIKAWWYLVPAILTALSFIGFNFKKSKIPLTGDLSIASFVITAGVILGVFLFTFFFVLGKKKLVVSKTERIYWRNFPSVLIATTLILTIILLLIFRLLEQIFLGATFGLFSATFIVLSFISVLSYLLISLAISITPESLIRMLAIIAIGGVTIAMLTNSEQQWWLANLSYLGSNFATSNWQFNFTLILAALIMISLIDFLFESIIQVKPNTKQLKVLRTLLLLLAIFLGGVGVFPYNDNRTFQILHNLFAQGMVIWVILLMVLTPWLVPNTDKQFNKISYQVGTLLIVVFILFKVVLYLSLTAFEILAFVLAFSWLLLLLKKLVQYSDYGSQVTVVEVEIEYETNE